MRYGFGDVYYESVVQIVSAMHQVLFMARSRDPVTKS